MDYVELKRRQSLSLDEKIKLSQDAVKQFYDVLDGKVYVSISGGKDSTVVLHLVRSMYPEVKAMFIDTGLEHPENRDFVKTIPNVEWVKPKKSFYQVLKEEGFPIPTKEQAKFIKEYQTTKSDYLRRVRWEGKPISFEKEYKKYLVEHPKTTREEYYKIHIAKYPNERKAGGHISKRWRFLATSKYKCSDVCCDILKKNPAKLFEKQTGLHPITGEMATDSRNRERNYLKYGCNTFTRKKGEKSTPLGFWTEKDVWDYIHKFNLPYSKAYADGLTRTGCMFCLFGITKDEVPRFKIMQKRHPDLYNYCMNKLGIKELLDFVKQNGIKIDY